MAGAGATPVSSLVKLVVRWNPGHDQWANLPVFSYHVQVISLASEKAPPASKDCGRYPSRHQGVSLCSTLVDLLGRKRSIVVGR